ncbi:hypothetical protein GCM10010123_20780 [Pilimelia anulata]|uniref:Uncharacterized protein n=1 Tax=Pilimelia anulata TaxID=53371 RepID=A0A8J3B2Z3_9ACTN|nr:hypothetical protein [Pilimelia anulata]GGJ90801.1 hypothetical protein GCM10010123_20780 [Pilimelia anulata]
MLRRFWTTWGMLIIGAIFVGLGVMATLDPDPSCHGVAMTPDQTCVEQGRFGRERVSTYEDKQQVNRLVSRAAPVVGVALLAIGGVRVARSRRTTQPA